MKKIIKTLAIIPFFTNLLYSCNLEEKDKLSITTTFAPIYDFTKHIVGNKIDVINFAQDKDVHSFNPAEDINTMIFIENSDLIITMGNNVDPWLKDFNKEKQFDLIKNITSNNSTFQTIENNPHYWLSITNASLMIKEICEQVIKIDNANETLYRQNADIYLQNLNIIKENIVDYFKANPLSKTIISTYNPLEYFYKDVGISKYETIYTSTGHGNDFEIEPIQNIKEKIISENIEYIVTISESDDKIIDSLNDKADINVTSLRTNIYESISMEDYANGNSYINRLLTNFNQLKKLK